MKLWPILILYSIVVVALGGVAIGLWCNGWRVAAVWMGASAVYTLGVIVATVIWKLTD